jgi:hypothetical protein
MTGPGLDNRTSDEIKAQGLGTRVFNPNPLNKEQFIALLFMVFYRQIMDSEPPVDIVLATLNQIFGQPWNDIMNRIRNMAPFNFGQPCRPSENHEVKKVSLDYIIQKEPKLIPVMEPDSELISQMKKTTKESKKFEPNPSDPINSSQSDNSIKNSPIEPEQDELTKAIKRYAPHQREVFFICGLAINRADRYKGQISKDYMKKNVPNDMKEEQCRLIFDQLKKDAQNKAEILFKFSSTSLVITDLGKSYFNYHKK